MPEAGQKGDVRAEARERVQDYLIDRCEVAGMVRPRGMSVERHQSILKGFRKRFAYMDQENLITLAELIVEQGQGKAKNVWPCEATVVALANAIQRCPPEEHRLIASWFASVEGPKARERGCEVELFDYLVKHRRPPLGAYADRQINEQAQDNGRMVSAIRGRIDRGVASADDRAWLNHYLSQRDRVRAIIEQGEQKREQNRTGDGSDGDAATAAA